MCGPSYYEQTWNDQGEYRKSGSQPENYTTSLIGNATISWIRDVILSKKTPFFAGIGPHAPHLPSTPANWYKDANVTIRAPRSGSYGVHGKNHHWEISMQPPLTEKVENSIDHEFQLRAKTLLSVDDIVIALSALLQEMGELVTNQFQNEGNSCCSQSMREDAFFV